MRNGEDVLFKKRRLLHDTVRNGNCFQLRYLLEKRGENIDKRDSNRQTALMVAVYTKYASKKIARNVLDLVLKGNPDLNIVDSSGRTALMHACISNNLYAVRLLVSENALDLWMDAQDYEGMTSLMYAVRNNNFKMVAVLLSPWKQLGLSTILENKYGENVMDIALMETGPRMCELLRENGFYAQNNLSNVRNNLNGRESVEGRRAQKTSHTLTARRRHGMTAVRRVKSCLASFNNNKLVKKKNRKFQDDSSSTISSRTSTLNSKIFLPSSTTSSRNSALNKISELSLSSSTKSCRNRKTFPSQFSASSNRNSSTSTTISSSSSTISSRESTLSSRDSTISSTSSTKNQQHEQLHYIFNLYAQQLSPSYKTGAASPVCLDDRDDAESLDSLASIQSFRSVGGINDNLVGLSTRSSPIVSGRRSRRSGAGLVVPVVGRSRKTSAPCFPSNRMFKSSFLPRRGEIRPNLVQ